MIIIVSLYNFINEVEDLMTDIAKRLSIVQPRVSYKKRFIEVKLETMSSIKIIFVPALLEMVKGTRPDYYWSNSYEVDKYFRECGTTKCLQNFTELTNLVLQTCQKDEEQWSLIKVLGAKYYGKPGLTSDHIRCNCLKETQIESYFNTINRNLREDAKACSFCENFEEQHDGNHIYKNEDGHFDIMADTGDSFQWGAIEDVNYCPYCGRRLANDI